MKGIDMVFDQIKVKLVDSWGSDRSIAHQAWASTYDLEKHEMRTEEDVRRVVSQVIEHEHGTPKERVWFDFSITCPIFVERQLDKYRLTVQYQDFTVDFLVGEMGRHAITQNELSGRYRTIPNRFLEMPADVAEVLARARNPDSDELGYEMGSVREEWDGVHQAAYAWYQAQLGVLKKARDTDKTITPAEYKRARELLRGVLGTAVLTDMRIICNLHALEWIATQRLASDTQPEATCVVARMVHEAWQKGGAPDAVAQMVNEKGWLDRLQKYAPEKSDVQGL